MTEHFQLDVNPEELRAAARELTRVAGRLDDRGHSARDTPDQIGSDWTGGAARSIKAEMRALGQVMLGFRGDFERSAEAMRNLAQDYEDALKQVADLNSRWQDTEEAYRIATDRADAAYDAASARTGPDGRPLNQGLQQEIRNSLQYAYGQAADTRRTDQHNLEYSFGMMKRWLVERTRAAGGHLVEAAPFEVTSEQVADWSSRGSYPVDFDRSSLWGTLKVAGEVEELALTEAAEEQASDDVARLNALLEHQPLEDPEALQDLLLEIGADADDPYYAEALTCALGPDGLNRVYDVLEGYYLPGYEADIEPEEWYPAIEALNNTLARGLQRYSHDDLTEYVGELAGPLGGADRLALLLASDNSDGRLNAFGAVYLHRVYESDPTAYNRLPVVRMLLAEAYPHGQEQMAERFAQRMSAREFGNLFDSQTESTQAWILDLMLEDNSYSDPVTREVWDTKTSLFAQLMDRMLIEENEKEVSRMMEGLTGPSLPHPAYSDVLIERLAEVLDNPAHIHFLATEAGDDISNETIARIADLTFEHIDVEDLAERVASSNYGPERAAEDLGYLLGLADAADTEVDLSGVVESLISLGMSRHPVGAAASGPLMALLSAAREAEEKYGAMGEGWSEKTQHEILSWSIYVSRHGEPPGYQRFLAERRDDILAEQDDEEVNMTDQLILEYQDWASEGIGTDAYQTWAEDFQRIEQLIQNYRHVGNP